MSLTTTDRKQNYWRQNGTQAITPRQRRRLLHKAKHPTSRAAIRKYVTL